MTLPFQSIKRRRRVKQIFLPLLFLPFFRDNSSDSWRNGANSASTYASAIGFVIRKSMEITQQKRLNHLFTKKHFQIKAKQQHLGFFLFDESQTFSSSSIPTPSSAGGVIARIANNQNQPRHGLNSKIRPGHISLYFYYFFSALSLLWRFAGDHSVWLGSIGKREEGTWQVVLGLYPPKEEEEVYE